MQSVESQTDVWEEHVARISSGFEPAFTLDLDEFIGP
jgi:hypothetical protein